MDTCEYRSRTFDTVHGVYEREDRGGPWLLELRGPTRLQPPYPISALKMVYLPDAHLEFTPQDSYM
jgi:hypothetical protein